MNNSENTSDIFGKKIFFLHPAVAVENRIISELVQQEYEVYVARNKDTLRRVLKKYPDSIVFIDVNEKMPEKEWESWVTAVMGAPDTKKVSIGILTPNDDEAIRNKYLSALKIACGYTVLKFDLDKTIKHILEILQIAEAKGRRKFLRASIENEANATINIPMYGTFVNGQIKNISVVGMACTLEGNPEIAKNALFKDIQVKLQSALLKVEGIVFGSRMDKNEKIYVLLFTQRIDPDVRTRIRKYIQHNLQEKMDWELK